MVTEEIGLWLLVLEPWVLDPIKLVMAAEEDKASIHFDDEERDIYELNLYWYTTKYELFKGASHKASRVCSSR